MQKGVQRLLLHMFSKSVRLTTIYSGVIDTVRVSCSKHRYQNVDFTCLLGYWYDTTNRATPYSPIICFCTVSLIGHIVRSCEYLGYTAYENSLFTEYYCILDNIVFHLSCEPKPLRGPPTGAFE